MTALGGLEQLGFHQQPWRASVHATKEGALFGGKKSE